MFGQTPQLSPMISNTIVKQGIGKAGASTDGLTTPEEREFEYKLGDFATTQVSYSIDTDLRGDRKYDSSDELGDGESDHESDDGRYRMSEPMSDIVSDKAISEENREAEDQEIYDRSDDGSDGKSVKTSGDSSDALSDEIGDGEGDGIVECSLLPHFATAEWTTISLV
ncbi:hypothetical protein FALBO_7242 [Fusarium albosuccineum]|uniref:Uncharacterized protein n=1 Tax=Fusarium albosuccineum TaxID=1237068 RepID=A0A8H4LCT3_9HYPO|nr:hypothetical protein FALBO_7242 [Fusarium albosuccineum]